MLIKAGTYRFNNTLTEGTFEQSIDITATVVDDGVSGAVYISKIFGLIVEGNMTLICDIYSMIVDGEEQITEVMRYPVYAPNVWQFPIQTHTITEDTEADDNFGTWYITNTDYNTVNGGETTPTKKFTRLYLGEVAYSSNGKRFRKLQTEELMTGSEGLAFTSYGDGTCYLGGIGTCTDTDIVVPSVSPDGDIVVYISTAFQYNTLLTSIVIPNSVTSISHWAFRDCTSLTSIEIPNSVISIGTDICEGCTSLASVVIGDGLTAISDRGFLGCTALTSVVIGKSVTEIGWYAFDGCTALTDITFKGTMEQWNSVTKDGYWSRGVPATYVQCTDGQVTL